MPFQIGFLAPTPPPAIVARMLANLERGKLAADPVQRAWMCGLHLDIPGITAEERTQLADQLAATGDVMRAAASSTQSRTSRGGLTRMSPSVCECGSVRFGPG